jgi:ABC-type dipeptide/oligopeptide/nickel transport system ATPase component
MTDIDQPIIEIKDLHIRFQDREKINHAVKGISFVVKKGETLAIVGESGSGKSVTAMAMTRLLPPPPACTLEGSILFGGEDMLKVPVQRLRDIRGKDIAYIFQEPSSSLNPYFTIGDQIAESIKLHRPEVGKRAIKDEVIRALDLVGIRDADTRYKDFPHQMSGGMKQRVMIAMALACEPKILVADEPTTALDVTIQAQIMDLMGELKTKLDMAIILITHNFGIVDGIADDIVVMYRGDVVETGATDAVLANPKHPYTKALINCIPKLGVKQERLEVIDHEALLRAGS